MVCVSLFYWGLQANIFLCSEFPYMEHSLQWGKAKSEKTIRKKMLFIDVENHYFTWEFTVFCASTTVFRGGNPIARHKASHPSH